MQFPKCLADTPAGYAGHAYTSTGYVGHANNSSNVWQTHLLEMLAMPAITPMSGRHPAGYAGHAYSSLNVFGIQFLECLWDIPAGYACCGTHLAPDPRIILFSRKSKNQDPATVVLDMS